jgi:putative permease
MVRRGQKSTKERIRLALFFTFLFFLGVMLLALPRVSIPLMVAYIIYLITYPGVPALEKLGMGKLTAVITVFFSLLFFTIYPFAKAVPTITNEVENIQSYIPKIEKYLKTNYDSLKIEIYERSGFEIEDKYIFEGVEYGRKKTTDLLLSIPKFLASLLEWIFLIPLFVFFLLKDGESFKRIMLGLTPNSIFEKFYQLSHQFNKQLGDYIFAKFVEASIVGVIITSGLLILDVRFALLLGIIAAFTNIIPYLGPILGFVPALLFALAEYGASATLGGVVILYLIANAIDMVLVFPILVSKIVDLHPILVVMSVILGSQYFGVIGMVVSIPVAAAFKLIVEEIYHEVYDTR